MTWPGIKPWSPRPLTNTQQVASYQRLLKWYLIPPCFTISNIRYVSTVKWSNPGKGVAPSSTPRFCSYWKGSFLVALDYGHQLTIYIYIYTWTRGTFKKWYYNHETNLMHVKYLHNIMPIKYYWYIKDIE